MYGASGQSHEKPPAPGGASWRMDLGDIWSALALADVRSTSEKGGSSPLVRRVAIATEELVRVVSARAGQSAHHERTLSAAAMTLEAAATCSALDGLALGPRRPHLLRQLERGLEEHERDILVGDADYAIGPADAQAAGRRFEHAAAALRADARPVTAARLEDALVDLAVLAVRMAINVQRFGSPAGPTLDLPRGWREYVVALGCKTRSAALRAGTRCPSDVTNEAAWWPNGALWSRALSQRPPQEAFAEVADLDTDRTLRAEALLATHHAWVRRAASQMALLHTAPPTPFDRGEQRLRRTIAAATLRRARDARLASRPWSFDHRGAWERDQELLLVALRESLDSPTPGSGRGDRRARELLAANVARAWLAAALVDAQLGDRRLGPTARD